MIYDQASINCRVVRVFLVSYEGFIRNINPSNANRCALCLTTYQFLITIEKGGKGCMVGSRLSNKRRPR